MYLSIILGILHYLLILKELIENTNVSFPRKPYY